jgi:hypothetical protein
LCQCRAPQSATSPLQQQSELGTSHGLSCATKESIVSILTRRLFPPRLQQLSLCQRGEPVQIVLQQIRHPPRPPRRLARDFSMTAASVFFCFIFLAKCADLAVAISSYCMPPSSAAKSFHGLCKDLTAADPLAQCAPGLELLGFGVDMTMCKSYGCRPSFDFDPLFDRKEDNT